MPGFHRFTTSVWRACTQFQCNAATLDPTYLRFPERWPFHIPPIQSLACDHGRETNNGNPRSISDLDLLVVVSCPFRLRDTALLAPLDTFGFLYRRSCYFCWS